jgi:hypothetical protein
MAIPTGPPWRVSPPQTQVFEPPGDSLQI